MSNDREAIEKAASLLIEDLRDPASIAEICEAVDLTEYRLKKGFRLFFGTTIGAYVRTARMNEARILLAKNHPVKNVASELGYANTSKFAQAFKKHFGCNPSEMVPDENS